MTGFLPHSPVQFQLISQNTLIPNGGNQSSKPSFQQFYEEFKQQLRHEGGIGQVPSEEDARDLYSALHESTDEDVGAMEELMKEMTELNSSSTPQGNVENDRMSRDDGEMEEMMRNMIEFNSALQGDGENNKNSMEDGEMEEMMRKMFSSSPTLQRNGENDNISVSDGEELEETMRKMAESYSSAAENDIVQFGSGSAAIDAAPVEMASSQHGLKTVELELPRMTEKRQQDEVVAETVHDISTGKHLPNSLDQKPNEFDETYQAKQKNEKEMRYEEELAELREILPMFSDQRLRRILDVFREELGDPSLIDLVLVVRERMPDYINDVWLRKMSNLTASYLMAEAEQEDLVDVSFLNSILAMIASSGRINDAIAFHQTEFKRRNLKPTDYSDRLVFQMFLKLNRFQRAMSFKRRLERVSRKIDIASYGSLVEYCAERGQVGSALMFIRECINVHGTHPDEAALKRLRRLLNEAGIDDDPDVLSMIGEDPLYWIRLRGPEMRLQRQRKGRKMNMVQQIRNATVQV